MYPNFYLFLKKAQYETPQYIFVVFLVAVEFFHEVKSDTTYQ